MKNGILFIFVFILVFSFYSKVSASGLCSSSGYTILTINGIFTNEDGALENRDNLRDHFLPTYNSQPLKVDFLYNPSHLAGVGDITDAIAQGVFNQKSDYDLTEILNDASKKVITQKLLIVGHSQGNFYANNFYDKVASQPGGVPAKSMGVYGVASPANYVAGGGKYLTSDTDNVIVSLVGLFIKILPPNIHIPLQAGDGNGHSFSEVYLKYQGDRIVSDIKSSLNNLKENDEQLPQDPCISPPELDIVHKITKVFYTAADPTANVVKVGLVKTYNAGVYIADGAHNAGLAIGNTVRGLLFASAVNSLPDANSVTTILPNIQSTEDPSSNLESNVEDNSLQKQEELTPENVVTEDTKPIAPINNEIDVSVENVKKENLPILNEEKPTTNTSTIQNPTPNLLPGTGGTLGVLNDITAPVITITGVNPIDVIKNTTYTDAGATAIDETDGVRTVDVINDVDNTTLGTYLVTYTARDTSNNTSTATRTVNVVADIVAPVISLLGNSTEVVVKNSIYNDAGATALDNVDGVRTVDVAGLADVNTSVVGIYTITYSASDISGNISTKTRTVIVDGGAILNRPNQVAISGNYAYVVSDLSNSLEIIDISNPSTLVHKGFLINSTGGASLFAPKSIAVSGNYAYIVSFSNDLEVIDISDPTRPVHKSTLYDNDVRLLRPSYITISGNYAYIISSGRQSIDIVNISNPINPVFEGSPYYINSLISPSSIFASGNYMYLTYRIVGQSGGGMQIIDISNPSNLVIKGSIENGANGADISTPRSIFVSGSYAYIASWDTKSLEIVDISNPISPVHKAKLNSGFGNSANFTPNYIFVSGNYVYITSYVGETLEVVDIYDTANPIHKGSLATNIGGSALSYPTSVFVSGNYAYVSSSMSNALEIVDISDPTLPTHKNKLLDGEFNRTDPIPRTEKQITAFNFAGLNPEVAGTIDETDHTVSLTVPFGTSVTALVPTITISGGASVVPNNGIAQNFINPLIYTVTAENGSTQNYNVTVAIAPDSNSGPDNTLPSITSYTFNGTAGNITVNPTVANPLSLVLNASENVNWTSIKIENQNNASQYKIFYSGAGCVDGTNTCTKSWDGGLRGGILQNGDIYRVKVHMKDLADNDFYDYLTPYVISIDTSL